jgi:predicted HicB family RNase H-like nuclease
VQKLTLRISEDQYNHLFALAEEEGISLQEYIRTHLPQEEEEDENQLSLFT